MTNRRVLLGRDVIIRQGDRTLWTVRSARLNRAIWLALFGPVLFVSALKLFDPSLKICGPAVSIERIYS